MHITQRSFREPVLLCLYLFLYLDDGQNKGPTYVGLFCPYAGHANVLAMQTGCRG